jgi:TolB protein
MAKAGAALSLLSVLFVGTMLALAPALSPVHRSQIAFESYQDGNGEIYLLDMSPGIAHNLTRHQKEDTGPVWSPDGRWIAFASNRTDNYEVYVMDANGGQLQNLTRHASDDFAPTWSPDGRQIAFISRRQGNSEIYVLDAADILANPACAALPDAFFVNENLPCAPPIRRLTHSAADEANPVWSPDGRRIAFVQETDRDSEIFAMSVTCDDPVQACPSDRYNLSDNPALDRYPAWSPDGRHIAFASNRSGTWDIYVIRADGSQIRLLTDGQGIFISPAWSPDGQHIVFAGRRDGEETFYLTNADGSELRRLTHMRMGGFRPTWRP